MHHRKSTSDGSQRSPGAPGGSPNLPFLRAYARTARNSEVVISFESSTLGKGKGVQVKKCGKQLSALAFDPSVPSVPCTFSRGMYYCLQTKLGWNQPTSWRRNHCCSRKSVSTSRSAWRVARVSSRLAILLGFQKLDAPGQRMSFETRMWASNISLPVLIYAPKNLSFLLIRILWSLGLGTSKVIMQSFFVIFKTICLAHFFWGSFSFWLSFITNWFVSFISITLVCSPCVLSSIEVYCLKFPQVFPPSF